MLTISAFRASASVIEMWNTTRSSPRGACGTFRVPCHAPGKPCANSGSAESSSVANFVIQRFYLNKGHHSVRVDRSRNLDNQCFYREGQVLRILGDNIPAEAKYAESY